MSDHIHERCCSARSAASSPDASSARAVLLDDVPERVEPFPGQARDGERARRPARALARQVAERGAQIAERGAGARGAVAVALVDARWRRRARGRPS